MVKRMRKLKRFGKVVTGHKAKSIGAVIRAGAMAEATYGSEVVGLSDAEWLQCRRDVARGQLPVHGGVSLTSKTVLLGDGAGASAIAPAILWWTMLWRAEVYDHPLVTRARLLRIWRDAKPCEAKGWPSSRGPLSRAVLAVRRAGWSVPSATRWMNHMGFAIDGSRTPPRMLSVPMLAGVQRQREFSLATQLEVPQGSRASLDFVPSSGLGRVGFLASRNS
ncbi:unnamed protein product [Prorocentrum cordatum]|uniref:Uncharacterized protein n=1 Tax=Prorocentrum cordatum TaxID=2364126 RepID=A0ABN9Q0E0_9DINO|nr:unnamed protein product [Polarella glacialis]